MDKAREVIKRGAIRPFSPVKRPIKQIASKGDISHRSKKDKTRDSRLIAQVYSSPEDGEMGDFWSNREEEARLSSRCNSSIKRPYKLHSKSLTDCNGIDHAAVPRKLRSAMDKRNHEYFSPPTKKHHLTSNGVEQSQSNNAKKSKQIAKQGVEAELPMKHAILDSITKDEEEVAETLFALARMSPNGKTLDEESVKSQHSCPTVEPINVSSSFEGKAEEAVKVNSFIGPTAMCRPTTLLNHEFGLCLGSSKALADCERSSLSCRSEQEDNAPLADAASSQQLAWHEASVCNQNPDSGLVPVTATLRRQEKQQPIKDGESCSPCVEGLWPSLPTPHSCGAEVHDHSSRSSLVKSPAILTSPAAATRTGSVTTIFFKEQAQQVKSKRGNLWKRCAAHVYISQLIKSYQTKEDKSKWPIPSNQIKQNERTKLTITTTNGSTGQAQSVNGVISMGVASSLNAAALVAGTNSSATPKHSDQVPNGRLQEKIFQQEPPLLSTSSAMYSTSTMYTKDKQNRNFLSLLAGGVIGPVAATNDNDDQGGALYEPLSQVHIPYLQSIVQHYPLMPFSLPHAQYTSSPQVQLAQYFGNPSYSPNLPMHTTSLPQQARQIRTAENKVGGTPWTHFPKWQNGGLDSISVLPCSQSTLSSPSPSPSGVLGPKFSPVTEQQQLFAFPSSSDSSKGKTVCYPLHGMYDGSGIRFYPDGSSHLQLLCNSEHP